MTNFAKRTIKYSYAALAVGLIITASLLIVARILLPEISNQRASIETWISNAVGRPTLVGEIEASWNGWSPRITFREITFLDPSRTSELMRFEHGTINIAPLRSIVTRTLQPKRLTLSGVGLTLIRHTDGHITVAGMPPPKSPVITWLIGQDNFAVTNANLTLIDEKYNSEFVLSGGTVSVKDQGENKRLAAFVDLPESIGRRVSIEVLTTDDPLGSDWDGMVHFYLEGIDSKFIETHLPKHTAPLPRVPVSLAAWTHWEGAKLGKALFDVRIDSPAPATTSNLLFRARGILHKRSRGWRIDVGEVEMPRVLPVENGTQFSAAWHTKGGSFRSAVVRGTELPLKPIALFATKPISLSAETRKSLEDARPAGTVEQLEASWLRNVNGDSKYFVRGRLKNLSSVETAVLPGVTGFDATVALNNRGGQLSLEQETFQIDHATRFPQTLDISDLTGTLSWFQKGNDSIEIQTNDFNGTIENAEFNINGTVTTGGESPALAKLLIGVSHADAARLHHMLPSGLMPQRGETWSRELFQAGRVTTAGAVIRGPIAKFPFDNNEGVFQADFTVKGAQLQYSRRWPIATDFEGRLSFRDRRVELWVDRGFVYRANIADAKVVLPDLFTKKRFVHIKGTSNGPARSAAEIVMASPLQNGKAARLQEIDIGGDIEVDLDLNLALFKDGPKEIRGLARFQGNSIEGRNLNIKLRNVAGDVRFTREEWHGSNLTAEFAGTPVALVMAGGLSGGDYDSELRMTGKSNVANLREYLRIYTPSISTWLEGTDHLEAIGGAFPWKASLRIPNRRPRSSSLPHRISIQSDLKGLNIDLPWPFGKSADESTPVKIETAIKQSISANTRIHFDNTMGIEIASVKAKNNQSIVERVEVIFGAQTATFTGKPGISLTGNLESLSIDDWSKYFRDRDADTDARLPILATSFDMHVKDLQVIGRKFEDVLLTGDRGNTEWTVDVSSEVAKGRISIPTDTSHRILKLDLEHLKLGAKSAPRPEEFKGVDPTQIPSIEMKSKAFHFKGVDFGQTEIRTARLPKGLKLEHLTFSNPDFRVTANGDWITGGKGKTSQVDMKVESPALAPLLDRFGYKAANIKGGKAEIRIDASWPGTPADFSLERMAGTFELHVIDGRFLDIDPGGGRLFGLLSLQTLPRRLSLDFSDLFRKGFAFDRIDGIFQIELGNAYTNSLTMEGPAARINVSGRTGLIEKDYDQRAVVTPALSSSIPVAAALFGPIGAGAGAVYYLGGKVFKSIPKKIDKFLTREYSIKGSWEDPNVEKI